jgi:two-component system chemotaxis response regulator CheB
MNRKIKILVVDDSAFMRRVISDIINSDYRFTVIGTAKNGEEGLEKVRELDPDVITLGRA